MTTYRLSIPLAGLLILGWSATATTARAGDDAKAVKAADEKFAKLLAAAQKDPAKGDWKAMRRTFAQTSRYQPYSSNWRQEFTKVVKDFRAGKLEAAEAALLKVLEQEGFMRIDGLRFAVALYDKQGASDKARKYRDLYEGMMSQLSIPDQGTSLANPIEVLFIEEEYFVLRTLRLEMKEQSLVEKDGHRFDVLTTEATADKPSQEIHFNIDMPWQALQASFQFNLDPSKASEPKKK